MNRSPGYLQNLAEALSPLSHNLAAGLLVRPVAALSEEAPEDLGQLCRDVEALLQEIVPAMRTAMEELSGSAPDDLEEVVDELATLALELVDMSRRIWAAALPPKAEGLRPLLATLAEAPAAQLLQWILEIMHTSIDPWSLAENPEQPEIDFSLHVPDAPLREALAQWSESNPGIIPPSVLQPIA